ncbi:Hypothetical protein RAK1035_2624 [Roseovarius sp. AK1035]|nr:Hypothetical protein RAK1035_2624 [Roseovarius sp. AK1035]
MPHFRRRFAMFLPQLRPITTINRFRRPGGLRPIRVGAWKK